MHGFAETCEAVAGATSKNHKVRLVSEYLRSLPVEDAGRAAMFFTGRPFPRVQERVLGAGGSLIWEALMQLTEATTETFETVYRKHGDLGATAKEALESYRKHALPSSAPLSLREAQAAFEDLSRRRGSSQKRHLLAEMLRRATPLESKYIVKIITGDLRIGLKENLVEEAIALAYQRPLQQVQRANMLLGDIGETLLLAARDALGEAGLRLFNPIGCMLASPVETAPEAIEYFPNGALLEDKYDGIRAQAHKRAEQVKLFSRTLDEIFEFPELHPAIRRIPGEFVLDGEIVAWRKGRALPFTDLQQRLGRKQQQLGLWSEGTVPVVYVAFDLLQRDGQLLLDAPLAERRGVLETLLANRSAESGILISPAVMARGADELQQAFDLALARGNEGLMAKRPDSRYTPGRRGHSWVKLKRPMATLDVVVTAVEYGHGKRHGVLSDYTFSVRAPSPQGQDRLLTIGKAYSGLTDAEILELTGYFKRHTIEDHGFRRSVEPTVVMEVAFNNIQRSDRHESGYALRFPRIVRLRPDKLVSEIDTLERVKELYSRTAGEGEGSTP
jgi:DNA ligase 1